MFPVPISIAATWSPALVRDVAAAIADEGRAIHNYWPTVAGKIEPTGGQGQSVTVTADGGRLRHNGLVYRSPVINISRDPRWGRIWEAFGEDTWLTSRMTVAYVKGTQGDDPKYGDEVVQLYVRDVEASVKRPKKQLMAFERLGEHLLETAAPRSAPPP